VDPILVAIILIVALALIFDFTNGFHDAANAVATVVATRALPAKWAPAFSAFFNFVAYFVVGTAVANTVAKTVNAEKATLAVIFAALFAAIAWNYITWNIGMPSSSSHAIIGGLVGAGLAAGGLAAIDWGSVSKAAIGIIASPVAALSIKGAQVVSAAALSFGHGANDAQKTMGVIAALLLGAGYTTMDETGKNVVVPEWVALSAYGAIALGTLWGGWKIIETMGLKITTLYANTGVAANIGAVSAIFGATSLGAPISTTHAAASSVVGAGIGSGKGANWRVVGEMLLAWVVTIPMSAGMAFGMYYLTRLPTVLAWIAVGGSVIAFASWALWAMTHTIHASDVEKEILPEELLDDGPEPMHPKLEGRGPVD
jgi:PiT family inorganic phosphate transporter